MEYVQYAEGTKVRFDTGPVKGVGIIRGIALTEQPVIGASWIIEIHGNTDPHIFDSYPYSHMVVFGNMIKEVLS